MFIVFLRKIATVLTLVDVNYVMIIEQHDISSGSEMNTQHSVFTVAQYQCVLLLERLMPSYFKRWLALLILLLFFRTERPVKVLFKLVEYS